MECLQILNTLQKTWASPYYCEDCKKVIFPEFEGICPFCFTMWKKVSWQNHPAVKQWRNFELALIEYGMTICGEWENRGFKDNCMGKIESFNYDKEADTIYPPWLGNEKFHLSHKSNLIRKNPDYYRVEFGNDIPDNLPYFWPTKELTS